MFRECVLQLQVDEKDPFRLGAAHERTCAGVVQIRVVIEGSDYRLKLAASNQVLQCAPQTDGYPFTVIVLPAAGRSVTR